MEPLLHDALQAHNDDAHHHVYFVSHGVSVWPVDAFPWSMTLPRERSGLAQNIGNATVLRVSGALPGPREETYSLDERQSADGKPEGNLASVLHWHGRTYVSAHICNMWSPFSHCRQIRRLRKFIASNKAGIIIGVDLNNPYLFDRNGRPGTYNMCCLSLPVDSILSNLKDLSMLEPWAETIEDQLSDHTGVRCNAIVPPTKAERRSVTKWQL